MSIRTALQKSISAKLTSLSLEDAQLIAEDYARIQYPKRFPRFDFRAFSPEGKARKGWPDAWTYQSDGSIAGVEATNTKEKKAVENHL